MYSIRNATFSDAAAINKISKFLGYAELSESESEAKLIQLLKSPIDDVYIAECEEIVIGWLHLFLARRLASPDFYEIGGLVVNPDNRGQGVGRLLVEYALRTHEKIRVRCNEKRVQAHQFYKAIGFCESKVQRVFEKSS